MGSIGRWASLTLGIASVAAFSACGGSSASAVHPVPAASNAGSTAVAVATATLTLKYPAGFHVATAATRSASSKARPAYVNSQPPLYLDVWVVGNGTAVHVINSSTGANIVATGSGSQTFSIPLYSTNGNEIVAYEQDQADGNADNLLAIGESDLGSFAPGSAPQISLTMQMNARRIGIMSDPDDANGDATTGAYYSAPESGSCATGGSGPLYFFAADADNGFVDAAGVGGIAAPTLTGWSADTASPTNTLSQGTGVGAAYSATFNSIAGGVSAKLTAPNLVSAIAIDAQGGGGAYPGIDYLYANNQDYWLNQNLYAAANTPSINNSIDIFPHCAMVLMLNAYSISPPGGVDPATQPPATTGQFPVLFYNGYLYWPFSYTSNPEAFALLKYDTRENYISTTYESGDRYISSINVNNVAQTVTFDGQSYLCCDGSGVTIDLNALP